MAHRRMLIEDFDLMIEARRAYLAELETLAAQNPSLSPVQSRDRAVLTGDTRLEGPLFMEWELQPEVDAALVRALTFLHERVVPAASVPEEHRAGYIEGKRQAIQRCRARLAGELGD